MTQEELRWVLAVPALLVLLLVVCPAALPEPEYVLEPSPQESHQDVFFDYSQDLDELTSDLEAQQLAIEALVKAEAAPPDSRPPVEGLDHYRKSAQDTEPGAEQALQRKGASAKTRGDTANTAEMELPDD